MSRVTQVAQGIAGQINAGSFVPYTFAAAARRLISFEPTDLAQLAVSVIPVKRTTPRIDRSNRHWWDIACDVGVQQLVSPSDEDAIEGLISLAEAIDDWLREQTYLPGVEGARWWTSELLTPCDPELLDELHIVTSVFRVTYRMVV